MTEEERVLDWLQHARRELPPPVPDRLLVDVLAIVRETPQLRRRGLRPTHGTERRISMFTPLRIAAVLAIIAAGTVTLTTTGPNLLQESPTASAVASPVASKPPMPDPTKASSFTARIIYGSQERTSELQSVPGVIRDWGTSHRPTMVAVSDPRLDGDVWISWQNDSYILDDGTQFTIGTGTWRIETAEGAWQGSYPRIEVEGTSESNTTVLIGEGAYEGLTAVWEQTLTGSGWDVVGIVIEGTPPPVATLP